MGLLRTLEVVLGFHRKAAVAEENLALAQPDHRQACDEWMEASEETVELVSSMWLNPHKGWRRACGRPLCTKKASHKKCPSSACLPSGNGRSRKYSRLLPTWVAFQAALLSLVSDHCHCARHYQGPCATCSCFCPWLLSCSDQALLALGQLSRFSLWALVGSSLPPPIGSYLFLLSTIASISLFPRSLVIALTEEEWGLFNWEEVSCS